MHGKLGALRATARLRVKRWRAPDGGFVDCEGVRVYCDFGHLSADWYVSPGSNLRLDAELFRAVLPQLEGDVYVDVGAHWGFFSRLIATELTAMGRSGTIISIEADPTHLGCLERTMGAAAENVQVRIVHAAAAATDGPSAVRWGEDRGAYSYGVIPGDADTLEVPGRTVDSLLEEHTGPATRVALMKIDVDGAEADALAGARRTMAEHRPVVFLEFSPRHLQAAGTDPRELAADLMREHTVYWISYTDLTVRRVHPGDIDWMISATDDRISDLLLTNRPLHLSMASE